jgi:ribosomal protein S18 acetylase RimI-like enzyme
MDFLYGYTHVQRALRASERTRTSWFCFLGSWHRRRGNLGPAASSQVILWRADRKSGIELYSRSHDQYGAWGVAPACVGCSCERPGRAVRGQASNISVRKARNEDAPGILACLREAFEEFRERYPAEAFLDTVLMPPTLQERLEKMSVFVAVNPAEQIVGTIACNVAGAEEGHLRGMGVMPSARGKGIAAQLLRQAEAELRSRHCRRVTLDTTAPLKRAMRFYEKHGYRRSGKVSDFFGMPLFEYHKPLSFKERRKG